MSDDWRSAQLPEGVTNRILLVRHGETVASARGRCYGKLDVELSAQGREQMQKTAKLIAPLQPDCLYSSPRIRALDSAAIIAQESHLTVITEADLAELDFGDFEGLRYDEVQKSYPDIYAEWMESPTTITFPNGESYQTMSERVLARFSILQTSHSESCITVVAHGGVIRIILADVLGLDASSVFKLDQSYSAVSCVDFYGTTPVVRIINWLA